ncbi:MAG: hypothetical protein AAFY07_12830 [Pseudomonadota bacterium]
MSTSFEKSCVWAKKNWFWVALIVTVFFGYAAGKDLALRDNAADQLQMGEVL